MSGQTSDYRPEGHPRRGPDHLEAARELLALRYEADTVDEAQMLSTAALAHAQIAAVCLQVDQADTEYMRQGLWERAAQW